MHCDSTKPIRGVDTVPPPCHRTIYPIKKSGTVFLSSILFLQLSPRVHQYVWHSADDTNLNINMCMLLPSVTHHSTLLVLSLHASLSCQWLRQMISLPFARVTNAVAQNLLCIPVRWSNLFRLHSTSIFLLGMHTHNLNHSPMCFGKQIVASRVHAFLQWHGVFWECFCGFESDDPVPAHFVTIINGAAAHSAEVHCHYYCSQCGFRHKL